MGTNKILDHINNLSDNDKLEFVNLVKKNLNVFFNKLEIAIKSKDFIEINQLLHKIKPTTIMLEFNELKEFINALEMQIETNELQIDISCNKLQIEKSGLIKLGWI